MSKKYKKKKEAKKKLNEPLSHYGNEIQIFSSFDEENEYTYRSYAALKPEECLKAVTIMRITAHPYLNINSWPWDDKIYFNQP